jgi:tryptophan halogenase
MKINSICIVGGGSSGWMSASALSKLLPNLKVTLVESPNIPTVGVGESTIEEFSAFLKAIQVKDTEWMKECNASFKLGIKFTNFNEIGKSFIYPFGSPLKKKIENAYDWLMFKNTDVNFDRNYEDFVAPEITIMAKKHKIIDNVNLPLFCVNRELGFDGHAYQLDAAKFAIFLRDKVAVPAGVKHILGDVVEYNVKDDRLYSVKTKEGIEIAADLFIDCTGFRSSILEGVFKSKHFNFKHLLNDSAYFTPIQYQEETKEKELEIVTDCTAINNGWVWNTPLWTRVGTGYVYSSKHVDKEVAKIEFIEHLTQRYGKERVDETKINSLQIRNGRHDNAWVSNVVAIGLSYGFIEPLESTGLWFVQHGILKLAEMLKVRQCSVGSAERHFYNKSINNTMDNTSWWVAMHFFLSKRDDTQYWKDCVDTIDFDHLNDKSSYMNYLSETLMWHSHFDSQAFNFIACNMGVYSSNKDHLQNIHLYDYKKNQFIRKYKEIESIVDSFPSHYEFLKNKIYNT